ncbi:MAG: ABC transporter substrate-binding protein [Acidiferrobacterales bacterium]|nr:ABC transporter substrate-binding protein [Acidiferrobacterales bacterium]
MKLLNKAIMLMVTFGFCVVAATSYANEKVNIAIISFSPYAPWYIVQEKGMAKGIDLSVRIIEDITAKNAAISGTDLQCMMNTLDSLVVAAAADVPVKVIAIPAMSYGLDEMVVSEQIHSVNDFPGKRFGADYAFLNHMWMLLTLKKAGIPFDQLDHTVLLPQDSAASFVSGALDIDVNYIPFSRQSLRRPGSHVLKTSLSDKTWERGLISESIACNSKWLAEKPEVAKELLRAWFEAVDWWKSNPEEGNDIIAKGLDWPISDVKETQYGAVMLNASQNLGAFGLGGAPLCASLPQNIVEAPAKPSGWGQELFDGAPDCAEGYALQTWDLFGDVYIEADVMSTKTSPSEGIETSILQSLADDGIVDIYNSNQWIGRLGTD